MSRLGCHRPPPAGPLAGRMTGGLLLPAWSPDPAPLKGLGSRHFPEPDSPLVTVH
jgi:hypothetical protein